MKVLGFLLGAALLITCVSPQPYTVNPRAIKRLKSQTAFKRLALGLKKGYGTPVAGTDVTGTTACPYDDVITCDSTYKYRTFDGSCNNLVNPFFGRVNTPFERFLEPMYEDGLGVLRQTPLYSTGPLIGPRELSTSYHQNSGDADLQAGVTHLTMEMGQFISHDITSNNVSTVGEDCCTESGAVKTDPALIALGCAAIPVPADDPFFAPFGRRCLDFKRAVADTDIHCDGSQRQQKSMVTPYLDVSLMYGGDLDTANSLRTFVDGLLGAVTAPQDGRELMLQSPSQEHVFCRAASGSQEFCFESGDFRVNQNPMLVAVHTIFLREHNRIARELKTKDPSWDDEKIFQETRRIVIAEYQHIVFGEYLPVVLTKAVTAANGLLPLRSGYYKKYDRRINPAIRSEFMGAAFRSGHSNIHSSMGPGVLLKDHFFNPAGIYDATKGIDFFTDNMVKNNQQKLDRLKTEQVTNHLFQFAEGTGNDLAATNIHRGRDHGLTSYNDMRELCGLRRATSFMALPGGLEHHTWDAANKLATVYAHVDDIEAWTGMSSEKRLTGGVFGPTAACIVAIQFGYLKRGDRFYYENDHSETKFSSAQLTQIRKASLSRLICDNTGITSIQKNAFLDPSYSNPVVSCGRIARVDLSAWDQTGCVGDGWSYWSVWTPCIAGRRLRFRKCLRNICPLACQGSSVEKQYC